MCKVNDVWLGVRELYPNAQFLYWFDLLEQLEFWDPGAGCARIAHLVVQDDGKMAVEIRR